MQLDDVARMTQLERAFLRHFGSPGPTHVARAPGRVNLIGEHTDYNGLPVFPMAIQRDVRVLYRERTDAIMRLANVDAGFAPFTCAIERAIEPDPPGAWANYVKAAAQALVGKFGPLQGFDGVVSGTIPVAAGLSSSSALVVATAVVLLARNGLTVEQLVLANLLARGERYVGTQGGGMDQAISLGGRRGSATLIEFDPLRLTPVPIPLEWNFVVASSLIPAPKSGSAQAAYNQRTRECTEALRVIADAADVKPASYPHLLSRLPVASLLSLADATLEPRLGKRFRHVITEASRVSQARQAMSRGDLGAFGRLMSASHESLAHDYEVSCSELDDLVRIADRAGADGARLTGAGFGGCIVALCHSAKRPDVVSALWDQFLSVRGAPPPSDAHLFVAEPSDGASVTAV